MTYLRVVEREWPGRQESNRQNTWLQMCLCLIFRGVSKETELENANSATMYVVSMVCIWGMNMRWSDVGDLFKLQLL